MVPRVGTPQERTDQRMTVKLVDLWGDELQNFPTDLLDDHLYAARLEAVLSNETGHWAFEGYPSLEVEDPWLQKIDRCYITEESDLDYLMDYLKEELDLG